MLSVAILFARVVEPSRARDCCAFFTTALEKCLLPSEAISIPEEFLRIPSVAVGYISAYSQYSSPALQRGRE
jgi:hypothetical protein